MWAHNITDRDILIKIILGCSLLLLVITVHKYLIIHYIKFNDYNLICVVDKETPVINKLM